MKCSSCEQELERGENWTPKNKTWLDANGLPHDFSKCWKESTNPNKWQLPERPPWIKIKVSKIQCPEPKCLKQLVDKIASNNPEIEPTKDLINDLAAHLSIAHGIVLPEWKREELQARVSYFRTHSRIYYVDPFLHVSWEEVSSLNKNLRNV